MEWLREAGTSAGVVVAAVAVLTWVMLRRTYRRLGPRKRNEPTIVHQPRPDLADEKRHSLHAPDSVVQWEVQMHDTARELAGQLDSKMRALQVLIAEADRAAGRLEAALQANGSGDVKAERPPDESAPPCPAPVADGSVDATPDPRCEEIYMLSDYGLPATEIARRLGSPVGEVELILGLRARS